MPTFTSPHLAELSANGASIKRPVEIGCFSYDSNHQLHHDARSLRYYYPPKLDTSLSQGFENFQKLDDSIDEHLDALLASLMEIERRFTANRSANGNQDPATGETHQAAEDSGDSDIRAFSDIVTWRGMMTKIMATPYNTRDDFEMNATCYKGTVFIEENHDYKMNAKQKEERQPPPKGLPGRDIMSYWGYKFEALSLIPKRWDEISREFIESRPEHVVNNSEQYCSIVRTKIGDISLTLGGEVDAVWDSKPANSSERINWVELKTAAEIYDHRDSLRFERKLNKFWIQSFLLGVPKIIVGFRSHDPHGTLLRIEELETTKIPKTVRHHGNKTWDSNACINFASAFLQFLLDTITSDGVWRIRKRRDTCNIELFKTEDSGYGSILSKEFVAWREHPDQETLAG